MAVVKKQSKKVKQIEKSPKIEEFKINVPPEGKATIMMSKGCTLKVGDFEFVRHDVSAIVNIEEEDLFEEFEALGNLLDIALAKETAKVE